MISELKLIILLVLSLVFGSPLFVLFNQSSAMLAWWVTIIFLFPFLLISIRTKSIALITISLITFVTQFITVPSFFILKEDFQWGHIKPFGFYFTDIIPILGKVVLFIAFIIFFFSLQSIFLVKNGYKKNKIIIFTKIEKTSIAVKSEGGHFGYGISIFIAIFLLIPLHAWMFSMGVSIVGVESPNLPYKLSGILHYLTRYIIPLWLGYLYWKSTQSASLAYLLLFYAWISGLSSVSRSALITVMLPILALAWIQRRQTLLLIIGIGTLIGYNAVTSARVFVQFVSGEKTVAITDMGLSSLIERVFSDEMKAENILEIITKSFIAMFERIEGFSNLVMAQWYDPNQVIGSFGFVLRLMNRNFGSWDQDLHHLQWQGNVLPEGYMNGGSLLSTAVILGNNSLYWIVLGSLVTAITLFLLEASAEKCVRKYRLPDTLGKAVIIFLCVIYFIESGGSGVFIYPFLIMLILGFLPKLTIVKRRRNWHA